MMQTYFMWVTLAIEDQFCFMHNFFFISNTEKYMIKKIIGVVKVTLNMVCYMTKKHSVNSYHINLFGVKYNPKF